MNYTDLFILLIPEVAITITALVVLGIDLGFMRRRPMASRLRVGAFFTTLGCLAAACWLISYDQPGRFYGGILVVSNLNRMVKLILLLLTVVTAWLSLPYRFTRHVGEYFLLLLLGTVGMLFLVSTENLLMLFVSLELLSLCLYILTALNKENLASAEAALKYFLFGGMSAAFLLFGLSLLYGVTGQINLEPLSGALAQTQSSPVLMVAVIMILVGFGFKVAAVPFHLWAPDTYQGAPLPCAAFIASGSKVAAFYILAKVVMVGLDGMPAAELSAAAVPGWIPVVAAVAALSVVAGNLAALAQVSVRRLLAYSAVAQAGYVLVGLLGNDEEAMASVLFYATTYALTTLGAFGVVGWVEKQTGSDRLSAFAGLGKRAPFMSICLLVFLLSLAGIPPLAGFFGKFYLFTAALNHQSGELRLLWLVLLAVGMSAVSLYYYLQVLKQVYVVSAPEGDQRLEVPWHLNLILFLMAGSVVVLGCAPDLLLSKLLAAMNGSL